MVYSYILIHKNIEEPQLTNKRKVNGERRENPILVLNIILQSFTSHNIQANDETPNQQQTSDGYLQTMIIWNKGKKILTVP